MYCNIRTTGHLINFRKYSILSQFEARTVINYLVIILALAFNINYKRVQTNCGEVKHLVREIVVNRIVILNNFK